MNFCVNTCNSLKSYHFSLSTTGGVSQQTIYQMPEKTETLPHIKVTLNPTFSPFADRESAEPAGTIYLYLPFRIRANPPSVSPPLACITHSQSLPALWRTPEVASHITHPWVRFDPSSPSEKALGQ